jgi:uncharacterized RDD family membrane protein YckC
VRSRVRGFWNNFYSPRFVEAWKKPIMRKMLLTSSWALAGFVLATVCSFTIPAHAGEGDSDSQRKGNHHDQIVRFGQDLELGTNESTGEVVVIGGSAKIHGRVDDVVVVIGGDVEVDGQVGQDVVVIMGNSVLGANAKISGELVTVGGTNYTAEGGKVNGQIVEVASGLIPARFMKLRWLTDFVSQCVLELRPLSLGVAWVWWVAGFFFIFYFMVAVLFPHPVQCCVTQISTRPATTFAAGVFTKLALPIVCLLLGVTVLGLAVIPFLVVGLLLTSAVGKVAVLEYMGGKITKAFGWGSDQRPIVAFLLGVILLTLMYLVPIIGFLTFLAFSWWGLGAGVTAIGIAVKASRPSPAPVQPAPAPYSAPPPSGFAETPMPGSVPPGVAPLAPPSALAYPRAGFWERMGAGFLDIVLVLITLAWIGPICMVISIAYFAAFWAWKGTTIGGMVLNLQVVRTNGQPMTLPTALVRGFAALFSAVVCFMGFFWIGWDRDKQGWHDKIAGTVVVRVPRAASLICI